MSYATTRALGAVPISVGARAHADPILAGASLAASKVMLARARDGVVPTQAAFDSLRLQIANDRIARARAASQGGGLGQLAPNDRATGCMIAGGAQMVGGVAQVIPVYGTIVGGVLQLGSQIAGGAMDCTREQREAQAQLARSEAERSAAMLALAQQTAVSNAARKRRQLRTYAFGGGILLAALGTTWFLFR